MEIVDPSSRYKIEESLGKGGMGEVLLAREEDPQPIERVLAALSSLHRRIIAGANQAGAKAQS